MSTSFDLRNVGRSEDINEISACALEVAKHAEQDALSVSNGCEIVQRELQERDASVLIGGPFFHDQFRRQTEVS